MRFIAAPNQCLNLRHQKNQGFTLIELAVIVIIVGVLAAISVPSFLSWLQSRRMSDALSTLEGAFKEGQRQAIRQNRNCTLTIGTGTNPTITATPSTCLPTGTRSFQNVNLRTNMATSGVSGNTVRFGFQGRTSSAGTVVLASTESPSTQRCLVLSIGLGIMRVGTYSASDTSGTAAANCTTSQFTN